MLSTVYSESANKVLLETVNGDIQILQLAEDCYWTIVVFSLAHEIAHAYLARNIVKSIPKGRNMMRI